MAAKTPDAKLSPQEWNFDDVPDDELVACCHWEYARESAFLRAFRNRWVAWNGIDRCPDDIGKGINRIERASPQVLVRLRALLESSSFPDAWQALPKPERDSLVNVDFALPSPFQRGASVTEAEQLLEEAQERVREFLAAEEKVHQAYPGYGGGTLRRMGKWPPFNECCSVLWDDGSESTIVRIAWEEFTNEEIVQAFKTWVKLNRPDGVGKASRQGQRKEKGYRDYLAWLGMMRLMNVCPFTSMKRKLPEAWARYYTSDWPRARQKAIGYYRELFPFLPRGHMPIHAATAGGRARLVGMKS